MRLALVCFYCLCALVYVLYFIATMSFAGYFLPVLFCMLSMLISDSRFDLVWFRLSCDHGWICSGSVNVRKQQNNNNNCAAIIASISAVLAFRRCVTHDMLIQREGRILSILGVCSYFLLCLGRTAAGYAALENHGGGDCDAMIFAAARAISGLFVLDAYSC